MLILCLELDSGPLERLVAEMEDCQISKRSRATEAGSRYDQVSTSSDDALHGQVWDLYVATKSRRVREQIRRSALRTRNFKLQLCLENTSRNEFTKIKLGETDSVVGEANKFKPISRDVDPLFQQKYLLPRSGLRNVIIGTNALDGHF